ncbi:hypothetical protein HanHA300_Chr09g0322401 [Helianthus annuus]|nr:hypothetical protein HanHA300_Chr09g0322401 [Helianthus annuus]KAJ0542763.1 hypothetical protein HanHA89_Chr09g0343321 [Helianthus annuus]KAJ0711800.1 hypothetical protein HanOQP8_Chr09g0327791 [Helianthus annuus]
MFLYAAYVIMQFLKEIRKDPHLRRHRIISGPLEYTEYLFLATYMRIQIHNM